MLAAAFGLLAMSVGKVVWTLDAELVPAESEFATPQSEVLPRWTALGSADAVTTLPPAETEREVVAATEEDLGAEGLWLLLVESRSGLPSADAKLRIWSPGEREAQVELLFQRALENSGVEELLAEGTESVPIDALGRARLARSNLCRLAVAERDGAWGWSLIEPNGAESIVLELVPDFSIDVRVREAGGAAVGDIGIVVRTVEERYVGEVLVSARTDAAGLARIEHIGWIAAFEDCSPLEPLRIGLAGPFDEPVELEFEQASPPTDPVDLIAPDGGDVELLTVDADGRALPLEFTAQLVLLACDPADDEDCTEVGRPISTRGRGGRAAFRRVPFGRKFEVQIEDGAYGVEDLSPAVRATCSPGKPLVLEVPCDRPTRVFGRAVNEHGAPWARTLLFVSTCDDADDSRFEGTVRTDGDGHFEFEGRWPEDEETGSLEVETCGLGESSWGRATVRLPAPGAGTRARFVNAGELVLERLPLIASGRVLDVNGQPARFVNVETAIENPVGCSELALAFGAHLRTTTNEQGRFEVRSRCVGDRLEVHAKSSMGQSEVVDVPAGSNGLELRLERTGSVRGRVVVTSPRSTSELEVELCFESRDDDGPRPPDWNLSTYVDRDGRFEFRNVPRGNWDLEVRGPGEGELATVESIEVRPGLPSTDPRLAAIELPTSFIVLRCVDERGWQALGLHAQGRALGTPANEPERLDLHGNLLRIPLEFLPAEVWLEGSEFLALHLPSVAEGGTLELVRAPILCMDLSGNDLDIPAAYLSLVLMESEPLGEKPVRLWFDLGIDGTKCAPLRYAGRFDLRLMARVPGLHMNFAEVPVEPSSVFLPGGTAPQTLQVRFDAEALRAAIAAERRAHGLFDETNER